MGGLQVADRPSLDRLKALDTLPDTASQLAEASQLCNHAARADMIAKWLLDKLRSSSDFRQNIASWNLLLQGFGWLSVERIASLLKSHALFESIISAVGGPCSFQILRLVGQVVEFLFDLSTGPKGSALQATLRLPASQVVMLLGAWLQCIASAVEAEDELHLADMGALIRPAVRLWESRRPSDDENSLFCDQCLAPAACLLSLLSRDGATPSLKRKRNDDELEIDAIKTLEALLARHVFLPARQAFFKSMDGVPNRTQRTSDSENVLAISNALEPLVRQAIRPESKESRKQLTALPLLLDIALRCTGTPSPRQRRKEQPWIEAVFEALHDCNTTNEGRIASVAVLVDMLKIIGRRASLSRDTLERLVQLHSSLTPEGNGRSNDFISTAVNWELIAEVIGLNSDIFCQHDLTEKLFESISKAEQSGYDDETHRNVESTRNVLLDRIVIPVMNALGRNRDLDFFVKLWLHQLSHIRHDRNSSIWTGFDLSFQSILEELMTEKQIVDLVDRLAKSVLDFSSSDAASQEVRSADFGPNVVVLNATLGAMTSINAPLSILKTAEQVFEHLMTLDLFGAAPLEAASFSARVWTLLRTSFELWFPTWMASQPESTAISARGGEWFSSPAFDAAMSAFLRTRNDAVKWFEHAEIESLPTVSAALYEAQFFIAALCSALYHHQDSVSNLTWPTRLHDAMNAIAQLSDSRNVLVFTQYPNLLQHVSAPEARKGFWTRCIDAASTDLQSEYPLKGQVDAIQALATTAVTFKQADVIQDLTNLAVEAENEDSRRVDSNGDPRKQEVMNLTLAVPADSLTRPQRERLLDALLDTASKDRTEHDRHDRLTHMIDLMQKPNATARLACDSVMIWRLALGVDTLESAGSSDKERDGRVIPRVQTIELLSELTRLVLKHLLATQELERSRAILVEYSKHVTAKLGSICYDGNHPDGPVMLAIADAMMKQLEAGAKPGLLAQLPHRDPETLATIWRGIGEKLNNVLATAARADSQQGSNNVNLLMSRLMSNALVTIYGVLEQTSTAVIAEAIHEAASSTEHALSIRDSDGKRSLVITAELIRYYALLCKQRDPDERISLMTETHLAALDQQPDAQQSQALLHSYAEILEQSPGGIRLQTLDRLFSRQDYSLPARLLLSSRCIALLEKTDIVAAEDVKPFSIIPRLLQIACGDHGLLAHHRAIDCILTALKEKPFLNNQHTVEATLTHIPKLLHARIARSLAFTDACRLMSALLLHHRARLHGRFHLVNPVFEKLISSLFQNPQTQAKSNPLNHTHAHTLSRLLVLLCEPLHLRNQQSSSTSRTTTRSNKTSHHLVDETRKEQAYVGRYVQYLLHHYCAQVLQGPLREEGMRDALTPGLWAVIDAIEMGGGEDGMRALSAAMTNGERAILRTLYEEWKRFGKWRGE